MGETQQGALAQALRVERLGSGTNEILSLNVQEERLHGPVAATYLPQDDAYYILDRADFDGPSIRLLRVDRARTVELVGEWPRSGTYGNLALSTSPQGWLVLSTWSSTTHNVAVLDVASDGLRLLTIDAGTGSLAVPAYAGYDGTFAVPTGVEAPVRKSTANASLRRPVADLSQVF